MTSLGLLLAAAGVGLIWAGITDTPPVQTFKDVLSGKSTSTPPAPVAAQPATAG